MATGLAFRRTVLTVVISLITIPLVVANLLTDFGVTPGVYTPETIVYYFFVVFYHWKDHIQSGMKVFFVVALAAYAMLSLKHAVYVAPALLTYCTVYLGVTGLLRSSG